MFPDLTNFRPALLVRRTKIAAFSEDYQQPTAPKRCAQSRRIPEWIVAIRFGHRQVIHILQQRGHKSHKDSARRTEKPNNHSVKSRLSHPRASTSCEAGASMARSRDCQSPHLNGSLLDRAFQLPFYIPTLLCLSAYRGDPVLFDADAYASLRITWSRSVSITYWADRSAY